MEYKVSPADTWCTWMRRPGGGSRSLTGAAGGVAQADKQPMIRIMNTLVAAGKAVLQDRSIRKFVTSH